MALTDLFFCSFVLFLCTNSINLLAAAKRFYAKKRKECITSAILPQSIKGAISSALPVKYVSYMKNMSRICHT